MLEYDFIRWMKANGYEKTYAGFPLPVAICSTDFEVYWSNAAAKASGSPITDTHELAEFLTEFDKDELLHEMDERGSCVIAGILPFSNLDLCMLPICSGRQSTGIILHLVQREGLAYGEAAYRVSHTARALASGLRQSFGQIFDTMDTMSLKADLLHAGWVKAGIDNIAQGGYRTLRIAENVAEYAKLQSGGGDWRFEVLDLCAFIMQIGETVAELGAGMEIPVQIEIQEEPLLVEASRPLLELALFNILHNSFYFTREGNTVHIRLGRSGDTVLLEVHDAGIGIPGEFLREALRPYRAFSHGGRGAGLGLGLALVAAVAQAHDAEVQVDSEQGRGTVVVLRFPAARLTAPLSLHQERGTERLDNRFSRLYVGLTDAAYSPYRN